MEGYTDTAQGYRVTALYDDGEPMSYTAVEIRSPGEEIAYQTGRTDRNGVMMFLPDRPGTWQAIITDGMGHRLALDIDVTDTSTEAANTAPPTAQTRVSGKKSRNVITGLAVIFGLFGGLYGWRGRRTPPKKANSVYAF